MSAAQEQANASAYEQQNPKMAAAAAGVFGSLPFLVTGGAIARRTGPDGNDGGHEGASGALLCPYWRPERVIAYCCRRWLTQAPETSEAPGASKLLA